MRLFLPLLSALESFTRLPVAALAAPGTAWRDDARVAAHSPGAGVVIGIAACVVFAIAGVLLHGGAYASLAAAAAAVLAIHLLSGAGTGAGLVTLLEVALLAVLAGQSPGGVLLALVAALAASRGAQLWLVHRAMQRAAGIAPVETPLRHPLSRQDMLVAAAWCAVPLVAAGLFQGPAFAVAGLVACAAVAAAFDRWSAHRAEPCTSAWLAVGQRATEVAFYLGAASA